METNQMTIHRALAELKVIDARIEKGIHMMDPAGIMQVGKLVNGNKTLEDFNAAAKSAVQSVQDLIERKHKIKSAIVKANAETSVKIGNKSMSIADAINFRTIIQHKRMLIEKLAHSITSARGKANKNNEIVNANAIELAKAALQKDNVKIGDDDAVAITQPFIDKNTFEVVDPIKIDTFTEEIEKELDLFESEVDAVLSEINAITIIEI